jgi:hypothetical protein
VLSVLVEKVEGDLIYRDRQKVVQRQRQRWERFCHQPRNITCHQKWEEAKADSPLEPLKEAWPC